MDMPKRDLLLMFHKVKLRHYASETSTNINRASGEGSTCDRTVGRMFKKFLSGDERLEDEGKKTCSLDNEQVQEVVEIKKLGEKCFRHFGSVLQQLHDIYRTLDS